MLSDDRQAAGIDRALIAIQRQEIALVERALADAAAPARQVDRQRAASDQADAAELARHHRRV